MMFKSKEEMGKFVKHLERRDMLREMSFWKIMLMFIISAVTTFLAFISKDRLYLVYEDSIMVEKLSYCMWCLFVVVLSRGIIKVTEYTGWRKFGVILSGALVAVIIVMCENSLFSVVPYYEYLTFNGFVENIVTNFFNDGIYGTFRFPVMFTVTILVSYAYSSKTYSKLAKKLAEKIESAYFGCRIRAKLIEIFNVSEEEADENY